MYYLIGINLIPCGMFPAAVSRKDSTSATLATKSRKESGSSHASTDTPSVKSEKDYGKSLKYLFLNILLLI